MYVMIQNSEVNNVFKAIIIQKQLQNRVLGNTDLQQMQR
jgi:hypothetical protein